MSENLQQTILRNVLTNENYMRKVLPFIQPDYFTGIQGRTHYVVISAESLNDLIDNLNSTLGSEEGRAFSLSLRGNREILGRSLINLVKSWEK